MQENKNKWEDKIKTHWTCRHSDKYDYSCGKCIDEAIKSRLKQKTLTSPRH